MSLQTALVREMGRYDDGKHRRAKRGVGGGAAAPCPEKFQGKRKLLKNPE